MRETVLHFAWNAVPAGLWLMGLGVAAFGFEFARLIVLPHWLRAPIREPGKGVTVALAVFAFGAIVAIDALALVFISSGWRQ